MVNAGVLDAAGTHGRGGARSARHVVVPAAGDVRDPRRSGDECSRRAAGDACAVPAGTGPPRIGAKDPIPAACEMVTALQTMATRRFDVFDPVVVTIGAFHAGTAHNVIPDDATFEATLRSFSAEAHARLLEETVRICRGIAAAHGLEVDAEATELYPVTVNSAAEVGTFAVRRQRGARRRQVHRAAQSAHRLGGLLPGARQGARRRWRSSARACLTATC